MHKHPHTTAGWKVELLMFLPMLSDTRMPNVNVPKVRANCGCVSVCLCVACLCVLGGWDGCALMRADRGERGGGGRDARHTATSGRATTRRVCIEITNPHHHHYHHHHHHQAGHLSYESRAQWYAAGASAQVNEAEY